MKPNPEEKCEHDWEWSATGTYCNRCFLKRCDDPKPSPSPEAHCLKCRASNFEGKCECDCHSPEARVDWEKSKKEIRKLVESVWDRHDGCSLGVDEYKEVPEACCYQRVTDLIMKVIQAAFEKGREAR